MFVFVYVGCDLCCDWLTVWFVLLVMCLLLNVFIDVVVWLVCLGFGCLLIAYDLVCLYLGLVYCFSGVSSLVNFDGNVGFSLGFFCLLTLLMSVWYLAV